MRADTITLPIEEKYTPEEKAEIAGKLACAIADLDTIRDEKKVSDAGYNERIKSREAEIADFAKRYNKGCETAQIGCDIRYNDPEPGKKSYYRMDRKELVQTLDMEWLEKQEELQLNLPKGEEQVEAPAASADALAKLIGDTKPCEHVTVTGKDGTYTCDQCGETLTDPPDMQIDGPIPPEEPGKSQSAGAN